MPKKPIAKRNSKKIEPGTEIQNQAWCNNSFGPGNFPMSGVFDMGGANGGVTPLSTQYEFFSNTSYALISLQRLLLSYAYVLFGPLRTLVDQPVYDAFRGGITIKTDEVAPDELEDLHKALKKLKVQKKVTDALRWDRLFGGAGLIINTPQDYTKQLNVEKIKQGDKLQFIVADRWELMWQGLPNAPSSTFAYYPGSGYSMGEGVPTDVDNDFRYNIPKIHQSRVAKIVSEEAPSIVRQRLQGWGMSCIEPVLRECNSYFKEQNVIFELLDEAKVDVWKIKNFNSSILSQVARGQTSTRIQLAQMMKNFLNAVTLDKEDDYEQKQISFTGLAEMMEQIRIGLAAAIRLPMAKIFGLAAKGFASGEDDIENYNAIVEQQREKAEDVLEMVLPVVMMSVWGFVPDDWSLEWKPLRVLSAVDEETVNIQKFNRLQSLYNAGILNAQEYCQVLKDDGLLSIETEVSKGAEPEPPMSAMMEEEGMGSESIGSEKGAKAKKEKEKEG